MTTCGSSFEKKLNLFQMLACRKEHKTNQIVVFSVITHYGENNPDNYLDASVNWSLPLNVPVQIVHDVTVFCFNYAGGLHYKWMGAQCGHQPCYFCLKYWPAYNQKLMFLTTLKEIITLVGNFWKHEVFFSFFGI